MRLPNAICPYKLAIVLPKVDDNHYMMSFSNDLIRQVASMPNLKDDILIDDRVSKSIGRRLVELNQVGIPNIVVMPAKKSAKSCDIIKMEFFRLVTLVFYLSSILEPDRKKRA
jgi:prolyl-tRNA synthetase